MKIGVLTQYWPSSVQPWAGHSAYQTVRVLAQRHDVRVFYPESRYPRLLTPRSRTHAALDPAWQPAGVATEYIPYGTLPWIGRPLNGWSIARRLRARIAAWKPDVLLSYVVYPDGDAAVRVARGLGLPSVLVAIGSDLNRIPGRLVERHTRRTLREATFTTTVSGDLAHTAVRLGSAPERTVAILNGCDTTVFHPRDRNAAREALGVPADQKAIVYVGRLDLRKGLAELVDATAQLRPTDPQTHTYLVGDGPDRPALEERIRQHKLNDAVHFVPAVRTDGVAQWMAAADLVTLPSYKEGCPNVVIEALAAGRPVVATNVGGIPELMDDTSGRLVPPQDVPALAAALEDVLGRPWSAEELAAQHSRSWADVAADLESVLVRARLTA